MESMEDEEQSGGHMEQKWLTEISLEFIHPIKQWRQRITREYTVGEATELRIVRKKETSDNDVYTRAYETFKWIKESQLVKPAREWGKRCG